MSEATKSPAGVALITGASRGLGRVLAHALAQDGWDLILTARDENALGTVTQELAGAGVRIAAVAGNITRASHREEVAEAARQFGGLDVVINNAGTLGATPLPALLDYPAAAFEETLMVNTIAPLLLLQVLRPHLHPDARILNITSDAAIESYSGWGIYAASKAALEAWSAVLAVEEPDLRVYWADPGDMRTAMHQAAFPGEDISDRPLPEESVPSLLRLINGGLPSGRYTARTIAMATEAEAAQ